MRSLAVSVGLIGFLCAQEPAAAQEGAAAQDPIAAIRAMHADVSGKRTTADKDIQALMDQMRRAQGSERNELQKKIERLRVEAKKPMGAFVEAFRRVDWKKLDPKTDAALLQDGLREVVGDTDDPERALLACSMIVEHFGNDPVVPFVRGRLMPKALLALGKAEEAARVLREAVPVVSPNEKANTLLLLGDVTAALGDIEGAKSVYAEIEKTGNRAGTEQAAVRSAVIGKPAAELDAQWVGGDALKIGDLKGKVVLVGFWASWSPTCRSATVKWNGLHDELAAQGLQCIGVTRLLAHGYLPADDTQILKGGVGKQGMTPDDYLAHVKQFHTNLRIHYPFAIAKEEDFKNYGVLPLPTVVLVDRTGRIALVSTAHDGDVLVNFAIRRLLAKTE